MSSRYERRHLWEKPKSKVRSLWAFWDFSRFSVHGDTQAVFAFEPPQSFLDEIARDEEINGNRASEAPSLKGPDTTRPQLKRTNTKRKDSMTTAAGFTEHLSEFLHEHGAGDIAGRLEAVEGSTERIEDMLRRLVETSGEDASVSDVGTRGAASDVIEERDDQ